MAIAQSEEDFFLHSTLLKHIYFEIRANITL